MTVDRLAKRDETIAMRIGAFQFRASDNLRENHVKITAAIEQAAKENVRLLVFQECATCGYPPMERPDVESIDFRALRNHVEGIATLAQKHDIYIAIGTIIKKDEHVFNSTQLIDPQGKTLGTYDKRALWGWDTEMLSNFRRGSEKGIFSIDGIKVGFRICFEVRFPEYFRELYKEDVKLCFVSFCDVSREDDPGRFDLIKAHLRTRAVENIMTVVSVNSTSKFQTAPTAVIDHNGLVVLEAPKDREHLLVYEYTEPKSDFGIEGRKANNDVLIAD